MTEKPADVIQTITYIALHANQLALEFIPYANFEAVKVRDSSRLEPVQRYGMYNEYPQEFGVIFSDRWSA